MSKDKIFIGSGVEKFDGNLIESAICLTDITKNASEYIYDYNGKKYINIKTQKKKETDEYGKTHFVEVNTWKPEKSAEVKKEPQVEAQTSIDDLPF